MQGPALCNPQPSYQNSYQGLILLASDNTHQVLKVRENIPCEKKCFYDMFKSTAGKEPRSLFSILPHAKVYTLHTL